MAKGIKRLTTKHRVEMSIAEIIHGYEQWEVNEFTEEKNGMESGRWEILPNWRGTHVQKVGARMLHIRGSGQGESPPLNM